MLNVRSVPMIWALNFEALVAERVDQITGAAWSAERLQEARTPSPSSLSP
jgi:hypothetical protein